MSERTPRIICVIEVSTDAQLVLDYKIGYADGSLLKLVPKEGELREELVSLGVITEKGRELLGGCVVVPIPDPLTGQWVSLYGRGMKADRHCYLPGPFRGVVNYQAAKTFSEIVFDGIHPRCAFVSAGRCHQRRSPSMERTVLLRSI